MDVDMGTGRDVFDRMTDRVAIFRHQVARPMRPQRDFMAAWRAGLDCDDPLPSASCSPAPTSRRHTATLSVA